MSNNEHESLRQWVNSDRPFSDHPVDAVKALQEYDQLRDLVAEVLDGTRGICWIKHGFWGKVSCMEVKIPGTWVDRAEAIVYPWPPEPEDESWRWL